MSSATEQAEALKKIHEALKDLRYGEVTIVVQDGVVVQVERTERVRLANSQRTPSR